jgi:hypothetical protein
MVLLTIDDKLKNIDYRYTIDKHYAIDYRQTIASRLATVLTWVLLYRRITSLSRGKHMVGSARVMEEGS